jgi:beta-glucanase (GH16 family)
MALTKYDGSPAPQTPEPSVTYSGSSGTDTLTGSGAAEGFYGGQGDRLVGGAGDDTYYVLSLADRVVEDPGGGIDRVVGYQNLSLADYPNVENLEVYGSGRLGAGNDLDNVVSGGDDFQQIYGGRGQDVLIGGAGFDIFIVFKGEGNDVIQDFHPAEGDIVRLKAGFTSFAQLQPRLSQVGSDVKLDLGGGDGLMFRNLSVGQLSDRNFQLELDRGTLGPQTFVDDFNGPLSLWDGAQQPAGVWTPDFDLTGPNDLGNYNINNSLQVYTSPYFRQHAGDFAESPFVSNGDGTLTIWAHASSNPEIFGKDFTSGLINTKHSFAQTYGYFEMRADVPETTGAWASFWLAAADGTWPPEADIAEAFGAAPNTVLTVKHSGVGGHTQEGMTHYVPPTLDGMHTYGLLWTPTDLVWYVDNVEVNRLGTPADMQKPMYLIADLSLTNGSGPVASNAIPFKIDYIRAYALPGSAPPPGQALSGGGSLIGGDGADTVSGGPGQDFLRGGDGADSMTGGAAFDDMHGNQGRDTLYGGDGDDWVVGGKDDDVLFGDAGDDIVYGNIGRDYNFGGAGNDIVRGGQNNDYLDGGTGNDWLSGDRGDDFVIGGPGADIFHTFSDAGTDEVADFNYAEGDRVQLDPGTAYTVSQEGADVVIKMQAAVMVLRNVALAGLPPGWIFGA